MPQKDTKANSGFHPSELQDLGILACGMALESWSLNDQMEKKELYAAVDWAVWSADIVMIGQAKRYNIGATVNHADYGTFNNDSENYRSDEHQDKIPILLYFATGRVTKHFQANLLNQRQKKERNTIFFFGRVALAALVQDLHDIFKLFPVNPNDREDQTAINQARLVFARKFQLMLKGKKPYKEDSYLNTSDMSKALVTVKKSLAKMTAEIKENSVYGYKATARIKKDRLNAGVSLLRGGKVYVFGKTKAGYFCHQILTIGQRISQGIYKIEAANAAEIGIARGCSGIIEHKPPGKVFRVPNYLFEKGPFGN